MIVYCAGPIFTPAQRAWLRALGERLRRAGHGAYVPAEVEGDFAEAARAPTEREREATFAANVASLAGADLVLACLDGVDADSGTAWEVGYAFARRIPVLGYRSDYRSLGREGLVNLMLERSCSRLLWRPGLPEAALLGELAQAAEAPLLPPGGKLVRDRVPEVVHAQGRRAAARRAEGPEAENHLRLKLVEEACEAAAARGGEDLARELADLLDACEALARRRGLAKEVERLRAERAESLGGFEACLVLEGLDAREP